jgi:AcrR family transcriptional regulator
MILTMRNAIPGDASPGGTTPSAAAPGDDVAARVARASRDRRRPDYVGEVRALLDAALEVMRRCGPSSPPRVADIVATAGLSNDAFYRHFRSKDALVTALLEDGAGRLMRYLEHQMAKEPDAEGQLRSWIEGVMTQADEQVAATTLAVLANGGEADGGLAVGRHFASAPLAELLYQPFAALGSADPRLGASLAAHAVLGKLSDHLWQRTAPTAAEIDAMVRFFLAAATATTP